MWKRTKRICVVEGLSSQDVSEFQPSFVAADGLNMERDTKLKLSPEKIVKVNDVYMKPTMDVRYLQVCIIIQDVDNRTSC